MKDPTHGEHCTCERCFERTHLVQGSAQILRALPLAELRQAYEYLSRLPVAV